MDWLSGGGDFSKVELWLKIIIFSLMVISLSQPFIYSSKDNFNKRGRDLVLVLDASGSMAESGFDENDRFKSRFDIILELTEEFINNRFDDNMGAVIFGTFAYSASPLTYDLKSLSFFNINIENCPISLFYIFCNSVIYITKDHLRSNDFYLSNFSQINTVRTECILRYICYIYHQQTPLYSHCPHLLIFGGT